MVEPEKPKPRRRLWKRILGGVATALAAVIAVLAVLPLVVPESFLNRQMAGVLSSNLGRAVTMDEARFGWIDGLTVKGLRIAQGAESTDPPLAHVGGLNVRMNFLDLVWAALGDPPTIDSMRLEDLEVWLVLDAEGRLNLEGPAEPPPPAAPAARPVKARVVQIVGGRIHFENRAVGRTITLSNVHASLGELAGTGQGYVNLAADLPGSGRLVVTAGLDSLDLTPHRSPAGSLKIEWTDASWRDLAPALTADPALATIGDRTSGRMAAAFGRGAWTAEGAVEVTNLAVARLADGQPLTLPQAVLGFQLRQQGKDKAVEVNQVKFSAPGIDVKAFGSVRPEVLASRPAARPQVKPAEAAKAASASAGGETEPPPIEEPRPAAVDLEISGLLLWAPLVGNLPPLKKYCESFEQLGGDAAVALHLVGDAEGFRLAGSVDLAHTLAVQAGVLQKEPGRMLRVELDASTPPDFSHIDLGRLEVVTDGGRLIAKGRMPTAIDETDLGRSLAGSYLEARAEIREIETLRSLAPALGTALAPLEASGPVTAGLVCRPNPAVEGPPTWLVSMHADLTPASVTVVEGPAKPADMRAAVDAEALLAPDARRITLTSLNGSLAAARLQWTGAAQVEWPAGAASPVGRFEGTLKLASIESAGAVLAPDRFAADEPLMAGDVAIDLAGELADGRLRGRIQVNLDRLAVRAADYFVKPAGQPASLDVTGFWQSTPDHYILAEATLAAPGIRLQAMGRGTIQATWIAPAPTDDEAADAVAPMHLHLELLPESTLELHTSVTDLAQAMRLSPALTRDLNGRTLEGAAETSLALSLRPRVLHLVAGADLTEAAIDLGTALRKPRGMSLKSNLAMDIFPPQGDTIEIYLAKAEVRLGESVTGVSGRVKVARPASDQVFQNAAMALALVQEVNVEAHADWVHDAALRQAVPWLESVYAKADFEGRTHLSAAVEGTPLKGKIRLTADASGCRILHGQALVKPAGTPASATLDARYGETPGELILDGFEAKLADSAIRADGRVFFDNPRLSALVPPTAWSVRVDGRAPDATAIAALFPSLLEDLRPSGGMTFKIQASGDPMGAQLQTCNLVFDKAGLVWLGKPLLVNGPVLYDGQRLATEGLNLVAGESDVTVVAYIMQPDRTPTGSVLLRGNRLAIKEVQDLIQQSSARLAALAAAAAPALAPAAKTAGKKVPAAPLSEQLALWGQRLFSRATLSCELSFTRVLLTVPEWNTTYELEDLKGEGQIAGNRLSVPRFQCRLNDGTISGEVTIDFRTDVPVATVAYDARDLKMLPNLKPFIDTTFPGMQVFGSVSQWERKTLRLAPGAVSVGKGASVLVDGLLEGPSAPDYVTRVFPSLKLTQYRFNRMSNEFENKENGDVDNRMLFNGKQYDIYIFGVTHADGRTDYELGMDLSVGLGSKVLSRTLDQGKLPLVYSTGRIKGSHFVEMNMRYVLPHEFWYNVLVRRNLVVQLLKRLGEPAPDLPAPPASPPVAARPASEG